MSEENVEIVRALYAAFSAITEGGGVDSYVVAYFDPDCEYYPVEEIDAIRGQEALGRWTERWLDAWDGYHDEVDEIIDSGEVVVAGITVSGRGSESGLSITQRIFHVFELRNGKVLRMREYLERDQALEAAGLRE